MASSITRGVSLPIQGGCGGPVAMVAVMTNGISSVSREDFVLDQRRGIPISLSAVYQSVAHSLGITLLPVNFPAHFLLKYPQNLAKGDSEVFIDAYGGGQLLNQDECLGLIPFLTIPSPDMFNPVDPYKAMIRMVANIYSRSSINFDVGRQWDEEKNQWGPLVLPSSLSLQLSLCWMSPVSDLTRQVASDAANIALDLRFNVKQ
uniref:Protein SirB1 N-terminal domain-containing protein n=1 Tax=Amphimedon queenslandica TaxID=400682 RepID=A0A1X7TS21_AMPQE